MQIIHPDLGVYIQSNHTELSAKVLQKLKFQEGWGGTKKRHNRRHPFRLEQDSSKMCSDKNLSTKTEFSLVMHISPWIIKEYPQCFVRYSLVLKTICRTCLCWYFCIKEISNTQLTNKGQPRATMTASESKNPKGHSKKWIWLNKTLLFLDITAVSRSPDEPRPHCGWCYCTANLWTRHASQWVKESTC